MRKAALVAQLESQAALLGSVLECADAALLNARPDGKWSARENVAHVARHQVVFIERVSTILTEDNPRLPAYSAESDADWPEWQSLSIQEAQSRFLRDRTRLSRLLRSLDAAQLQRRAAHPVLGSMTLEEWFAFFVVHASHHFYVAMKRVRGGR